MSNKTAGLKRQQETYISQLRELQKSKPRGQIEENLTAEMSRLESALTLARDDLVGALPTIPNIVAHRCCFPECQQSPIERHQRRVEASRKGTGFAKSGI